MKSIRVFYSWQSDTDWHCGQNFIYVALKEAAARVGVELGVDIVLDHDTLGVPGQPPVSDTILGKIRDCDIFLGDMTFVGTTDDGKKRIPNPNVLGEYGYALRDKTTARIILVMNEAHGDAEKLPFDLRNLRHPLKFDAPDALSKQHAERRKRRDKFTEKLAVALKETAIPIIAAGRAPTEDSNTRAEAMLTRIQGQWNIGEFPALIDEPKIRIAIAPHAQPECGRLRGDLVDQFMSRLVPAGFHACERLAVGKSWTIRDKPRHLRDLINPFSRWFVRVHHDGAVDASFCLGELIDDDPFIVIAARPLEARIVDLIDRISEFLGEMGLQGPAEIMFQINPGDQPKLVDRKHNGRLIEPFIGERLPSVRGIGAAMGDQLQPMFDAIWMAGQRFAGSPSFEGSGWAGYAGTEDYQIPVYA